MMPLLRASTTLRSRAEKVRSHPAESLLQFLNADGLHRRAQAVDGGNGFEAVPPFQKLLSLLLQELLSFAGHGLTSLLVAGHDLLEIIHIVGFHAVHSGSIGSNVAGHTDVDQPQFAASVEGFKPRCIDDRIVCSRAGETPENRCSDTGRGL